jgi:hypothetical protein
MTVRFPTTISDTNREILTKTSLKGDTGDSAWNIFPKSPIIPIPCDNDGSNPVYTSASSEILIMRANLVQTGWTLAYVSGSGCNGTVNNTVEPRQASIANVSAPSGYAEFTATKDGVVLLFRLYFSKVPEGATGSAGATGATGPAGAAGATGAAGSDGTGLVVVKKEITVGTGVSVSKQDYGDGNLQINYPSSHGLLQGDYVWIYLSGVYNGGYEVLTVVDADSVKLNVAYSAAVGTVTAYDAGKFRALADNSPQVVALNNFVPYGSKVLEWHIIWADANPPNVNPVSIDFGDTMVGNLGTMYGNWITGGLLTAEGSVLSRDRRSTLALNVTAAKNMYLMLTPGGPELWNTYLQTIKLELLLAYINFNPTYTP